MKKFKTTAHINSLDGKLDEITVLDEIKDGQRKTYIVDYRGVKCTADVALNFCQAALATFEQKLTAPQSGKRLKNSSALALARKSLQMICFRKIIFNVFTNSFFADDVYGRLEK